MDPDQTIDREFMWIAKQGLMEPVPEPWQAMKDQNDNIVYVNKKTEQETHQHPCDDLYRQLFIKERSEYVKKMYGGVENVPANLQHLVQNTAKQSQNAGEEPEQLAQNTNQVSNTKSKRSGLDIENPSQGDSQREEVRDEVLDLGQNLTQSQSKDKILQNYPADLNDLN